MKNRWIRWMVLALLVVGLTSVGASQETVLDDFEYSDLTTEWNQIDTGVIDNCQTQQSTVFYNSYSLECEIPSGEGGRIQKDSMNTNNDRYWRFVIRAQNHNDEIQLRPYNGGQRIFIVGFDQNGQDGEIMYFDGSWKGTGYTVSEGEWVRIQLDIDWANTQYDIEVVQDDGSVQTIQTGASFNNNYNEADSVVINIADRTSSTDSVYMDLIRTATSESDFTTLNSPPSFDSVSTSPSSWTLGSSVNVSANVTDDGSVSSVSADVYENGTQIISDASLTQNGNGEWTVQDLFTVDQADIDYRLELTATDNYGATTTYTRTETIFDSSAGLKAAEPKNKTYGTSTPPYDVYLNDDGDDVENETASCTLYQDGSNFTSFTLQEGGSHETGTLPSSSDGTHTFEAQCTEDQGGAALDNIFREFEIDTTEPDLNITAPIGYLDIKKDISLNYDVSDTNLDSCKYNVDGGTNISLPSCGTTTFDVGTIGNHTVKVYANDTIGNQASDSQSFTADYRNVINVSDADSGSTIDEYQVTFTNGETAGGSTTNGTFSIYTSELPQGDVNMTLKSDGYQTRTVDLDIDDSFELREDYQLTRAGFYLDVKDEVGEGDIQFNFTARNETTSFTQEDIAEFDQDYRDFSGFPTGDVSITVQDVDGQYKSRTFFAKINENSRVSLTAYLLKLGDGIYTSIEVVDSEQDAISGAQINIQKLFGASYKTVAQRRTSDAGGASFYLDPDMTYRAYVTHPNYVGFQGTFAPANYQYDPLIIQLGSSSQYNFSTRWDSVSYKLEPRDNILEGEGDQTFNWTVMDSQNDLTELGVRLWDNGTEINSDSLKDSPSGGTVSITEYLGNYSSGKKLKVEGYFLSGGETYSLNRTYTVRKGFDQGVFSIDAIFYELKKNTSDTAQGFIALIVTFLAGLATGKTGIGGTTGGGFVAILVLGVFTWKGMFPGFIFILTLLLLIGVWASRRY